MTRHQAVVLIPLDEYEKACRVLSAIGNGRIVLSDQDEWILDPKITDEFTVHDLWQTAFGLRWSAAEEETTQP